MKFILLFIVIIQSVFGFNNNLISGIDKHFETRPYSSIIDSPLYKTYTLPSPPEIKYVYYVPTVKAPGFWDAITGKYGEQELKYYNSFKPINN